MVGDATFSTFSLFVYINKKVRKDIYSYTKTDDIRLNVKLKCVYKIRYTRCVVEIGDMPIDSTWSSSIKPPLKLFSNRSYILKIVIKIFQFSEEGAFTKIKISVSHVEDIRKQ